MTNKILHRMTLIAGALSLALAIGAQPVLADGDDDDDDDRRGNRACKVLMVTVDTEENTVTVTGKKLPRRPKVWFGGVRVPVLDDPLPSTMEIVIDVSDVLEGPIGPTDFLLEIKHCPSHLVTVSAAMTPIPPPCLFGVPLSPCQNSTDTCEEDPSDTMTGIGSPGICVVGAPL
jgi:hypothetical protein